MMNALFLLLVASAYVLIYWRPGVACGLLICGFVVEQAAQTFVPIAGQNDTITNYLIAVGVFVGALRQILRHGRAALRTTLPGTLTLALLALCYLSTSWSIFPSTSTRHFNDVVPFLLIFAGLAPLTVQTTDDLEDCLKALVHFTSVSLGLLLLFGTWRNRSIYLPFTGDSSNPLALTQAAGSVLIAVALVPLDKLFPPRMKLFLTPLVVSIVLLTFLRTASRGQIVAALGTAALFSSLTRRTGYYLFALAALGMLMTSDLLEEEIARNSARWDASQMQEDVGQSRVAMAIDLLDRWSSAGFWHVTFGLGHATARDPRLLGTYPHIVPVEVLCEEGLFGALLLGMALILAIGKHRASWSWYSPLERPVVRVLGALLLYEFLLTLKQGTITGNVTFLLFLCLSMPFSRSALVRNMGPKPFANKTTGAFKRIREEGRRSPLGGAA